MRTNILTLTPKCETEACERAALRYAAVLKRAVRRYTLVAADFDELLVLKDIASADAGAEHLLSRRSAGGADMAGLKHLHEVLGKALRVLACPNDIVLSRLSGAGQPALVGARLNDIGQRGRYA